MSQETHECSHTPEKHEAEETVENIEADNEKSGNIAIRVFKNFQKELDISIQSTIDDCRNIPENDFDTGISSRDEQYSDLNSATKYMANQSPPSRHLGDIVVSSLVSRFINDEPILETMVNDAITNQIQEGVHRLKGKLHQLAANEFEEKAPHRKAIEDLFNQTIENIENRASNAVYSVGKEDDNGVYYYADINLGDDLFSPTPGVTALVQKEFKTGTAFIATTYNEKEGGQAILGINGKW